MKTQLVKFITKVTLLSAIAILTSVASAQGQSLAYKAKFNVPFDFAFGAKKLPAGKYSIGRAIYSSDDTTVSMTNLDGHSTVIVLSNAVITSRANSRASLVFHRYGNEYFLIQVWPAGATTGREFSESKRERALQRQLAANLSGGKLAGNMKCEIVIVAAASQ